MEAIITVDLSYGDVGKGATIDAMTRRYGSDLIVRYNGASQAGHNVVTDDGVHHLFSQFGSGMLASQTVRSVLAPGMLVDPLGMLIEAEVLASKNVVMPLKRSYVHEDCLIITPFMIALNRIKETMRSEARHGSCGKGVGETRAYALRVGDEALTIRHLANKPTLKALLERVRDYASATAIDLGADPKDPAQVEHFQMLTWDVEDLANQLIAFREQVNIIDYGLLQRMLVNEEKPILFEGAQGVLLDQTHGFAPFHTWTDTTANEAQKLLALLGYRGQISVTGITRSFVTRHGPGPCPTEDEKLSEIFVDPNNPFNPYQREFRVGWLDLPMLRYALEVQEIDNLVVTHLDWLDELDKRKMAAFVGVRYMKEGQVYNLRPTQYRHHLSEPDLELASDLSICDVVYETFNPQDILSLIKAFTGSPLLMAASGPSYKDREFFKV